MKANVYATMKTQLEGLYPAKVGETVIKRLRKKGLRNVDKSRVSQFFAGNVKTNLNLWLEAIGELLKEGRDKKAKLIKLAESIIQ